MEKRKKNKICIICLLTKNETIELSAEDHFMIALEKPYMNLYSHKQCFKNIQYEELLELLENNLNLVKNT